MREKDEMFNTIGVDDDICCKDCRHKNQGMKYPHYTKGSCGVYPSPETKPLAVLFEKAVCEHYEKE